MAGGTWSPTEGKERPGFYLNFIAAALAAIKSGARGVVAVPVKAHWGPVRQFVDITDEAGIIKTYTTDSTSSATAYDTLRFALLGGAKTVKAYRLATDEAVKSTRTLQDGAATNVIILTAKYEGERGNNFKVTVRNNLVDSDNKKDILLYEGTALLRTFTFAKGEAIVDNAVAAINNDTGNEWITATQVVAGNGTLADITTQPLSGGNSGIAGITNTDYMKAVDASEAIQFNLLTMDGITDPSLQTSIAGWVSRVRSEGKGVVAVLGGSSTDDQTLAAGNTRSQTFNHEGIINVTTGAVLDGVSYTSAQVAPYIAGLIAGQKLSESITYASTPFDDVTRRYTHNEVVAALQSGSLILVHDGEKVKVERGINTLTSLRQGQNNQWKKIRAIRTMDSINADLLKAAEDNYIGKVNNNEDGQAALLAAFKQYMETMVTGGVILRDFAVYLDPQYHGKNPSTPAAADEVYPKWEAYITDTMEKIFGTFIVKSN
jgi:hypothetical protein